MPVLADHRIETVHHYAPLHYLIFIARSRSILSKPSLHKAGFTTRHLRSMSHGQDIARGFGSYSHLTIDARPRILRAKLAAGFPHIAINIPASEIDAVPFSLCRFNVAMTRQLRRGGKEGFPESRTNGRYYAGHQIPIARTDADKSAMLQKHLHENTMIEVLVHGDFNLPDETFVSCFSDEDASIARRMLSSLKCKWRVTGEKPPGPYPRDNTHVGAVIDFIQKAESDPDWRGNGLEFDRLKPK
ncbi:hypothetical protein [Bradyrhizobium erythrophlei]|uniref:Uncharacterized protein n=1 Tax=Bradyrhizobium erythrophlei TaxID=1437360 RepID=A0A1M5YYI4_9BRAD|nr:hypothetical protein [Bradyrhizobium erythrophlei]SHI17025.1 hypothetical protein SAMN05443248_8970 [Bradyrhizobium erythrophlei]